MKKLVLGLLMLILVTSLVFAGCSQPATSPSPAATPSPTQAKPAAPVSSPTPAAASSAEAAFYKGKTVTWLCGTSAGGGHDLYSRMVAAELEKVIGATVVVKNVLGASGGVAFNQLYNSSESDGLLVGWISGPTAAVGQLVGDEAVKYDMAKYQWLARVATDTQIIVTSKTSPFKTIDDIKKAAKVKCGTTTRTAMLGLDGPALGLALDLKNLQIVAGYPGDPEVQLATMKGECDIQGASVNSALKLIESGDFIPLVTVSNARDATIPKIPTIYEIAPNMTPENKKWVDRIVALLTLGRAVAAPPIVPQSKVDFLRGAIGKIMVDPAFIKSASDKGRPVDYMAAEEYKKYIASITLTTEEKAQFKAILEKY